MLMQPISTDTMLFGESSNYLEKGYQRILPEKSELILYSYY